MRGIDLLHPELQTIARKFETECKAAGLNVLITETWRTIAEQDTLYAKGRTTPGSIVTNCKGSSYQSPHQWGVAFDFCRNVKGREFDNSDKFFNSCGAIGKKIGLFWGGDFKSYFDGPHLEYIKFLPSNSTAALKKQYGAPEKFKASWNSLSKTEEDVMTQEQFNKMMDEYLRQRNGRPASSWAKEFWEKVCGSGIMDGSAPQGLITREQAAALIYKFESGGKE